MKQLSTSCIGIFALLGLAGALAADMPYAGQQTRTIKALSDQEVSDYVEGRGMGSSKAAELNHYPGPAHVLADSSRLELTDRQKAETQSVFDAMSAVARRSGAAIVAGEAELDALYASGRAAPAAIKDLLTELARLQAEFRYAHLNAHLAMRTILTPEQIARYDEMRGYTAMAPGSSPSTETAPAHQHTHH
ncbi:MAG TPA: Spy/CpxP family protein refolding chaperone [Casimicrobiaceae bacterium]|jgi:Spy/CpxP family protein refolding chaperone|nr:Spy/CpxP family protein refolding chaperone [Casimicrobiaceae bacterium]